MSPMLPAPLRIARTSLTNIRLTNIVRQQSIRAYASLLSQEPHKTLFKMAAESAARSFMATPQFAVVGASSDPSKFGHKILAWYLERSLPVTPINPTAPAIKVAAKEYPAVKSISEVQDPKRTAVSIITPPKVTINVLKDAKEKGVQSVWLQPGTFNNEVMKYARENFENVIGGDGGMGSEGWCVLVDGDKALQGREKL